MELATSTTQILASRAGAELERQRADAQIREQASLLDKAQDAIFVQDLEQRVTYWNQSAQRLFEWSSEEVLGQVVPGLVDRALPAIQVALTRLFDTGEWLGELQQVSRSGREFTVEARWTLVRDEAGQPCGILSINTDITQSKALEVQFLRAQRLESIGTLAGGIAHDLNNMLTPISTGIELLATTVREPDNLEILDILRGSAQRGAEMVRQVLTFARGVPVKSQSLDPEPLLQEMGKFARETFDPKIAVRVKSEPSLWPIAGDVTQLHQLLLNLCVNSRDAMPGGGELLLSARNIAVDELLAATNPDAAVGRYVCLEVRDQGTGMTAEVAQRMFEPFFTTKELGQGTGLGLSTVQAIVKSHRGFVQVESRPHRGSSIKVYLPVDASGSEPTSAQAPTEMPRGTGELVLVVDDEQAVRAITGRTLESFGYRVIQAGDGAEAVAQFAVHSREIRLVVTDIMMPVMDGFATIRALQHIRPDVRVVAASGLESNADRAASLGVRHFLPKPFSAGRLLREVRLALDETSP